MEREIGEKFTIDGVGLLVVENCNLPSTFYRKGFAVCTTDCFFCLNGSCYCNLKVAGDCQRAQRSDRRNVYFVDAALARSPLGAAAANSAKIPIDASKILHLHLKKEWYNMILNGVKTEEYRDHTEYWHKRFANKNYTHILFYYGYTKTRMLVPILYIKEGVGRTDWGAPSNKIVYIFGLGGIIDENRWKILRDV